MADNYLERRQEDYERRKARWILRKKHIVKVQRSVDKPDDEALKMICFNKIPEVQSCFRDFIIRSDIFPFAEIR